MEDFLATVGAQACKYAVRSGIALTSKYAMRQCSRLLETMDDCEMHARLLSLQKQFDSKIMVIAPTIDLVEFKSGRGNVFLDSALPLTKALHGDIVSLGRRIDKTASFLEIKSQNGSYPQRQSNIANLDIQSVVADIASMLDRIDREIPLLQLAITASGESLSSSLPPSISPSRLLQASTLLIVGDMQFHSDQSPVQIGPSFCLSLYMLFLGHAPVAQVRAPTPSPGDPHTKHDGNNSQRPYGLGPGDRKPIWQEVIHKARVTLHRTKALAEYSYYLEFTEDLDDGRLRDEGEACTQIRQQIPIHQISKIFYTDSGRLLNIGDETADGKNPVLLFKRDPNAQPPASEHKQVEGYLGPTPSHDPASFDTDANDQLALDQQLNDELRRSTQACHAPPQDNQTRQVHSFPKHVDPEWIALEMYEDIAEEHGTPEECSSAAQDAVESWSEETDARSDVCVREAVEPQQKSQKVSIDHNSSTTSTAQRSPFSNVTTSLSLIEMLVRLAGLQEFQQTSHLSIPDHILTFFLEESSTTGLGGEAQWAARQAAKARVGFDPYLDSSPRKQNNV
ncbi:RanGTP-binding protein-domain-containing protein [Emericellopsis atlantica]|uniref:RanGTP-binding protein-domain-containing protein n=1 Tax=Emericellopsis atlantica TaxID=2614577 RepID=A0A9P7ZGI4_9HYPO|nr:RanGTP-binding protein-domain-containing protein [Emericellopsis atlantica]KAG9251301.1 RanGTP-binding protein-domain-containing protein [Emericellopsis atlantica]